jgi:PadR family transcriptional regulator PadR
VKNPENLPQATLDLLVLRLLRSGSLNGWEMMQRISLISNAILTVTPGSLYPALHRLEAGAFISAEWGASENNRRAKYYKLTAAGRKQLEAERQSWERFVGAVGAILGKA